MLVDIMWIIGVYMAFRKGAEIQISGLRYICLHLHAFS